MTNEPSRIDSWKGIADHLRCDITTAMRWERERALPIHRHPGEKRSPVYAFRLELDEWLARGPVKGPLEKAEPDNEAGDLAPKATVEPTARDSTAPSLQATRNRDVTRRSLILAAMSLMALIGMSAVRNHEPRTPASVRIEGAALVALGPNGLPIWKFALKAPPPLNPTSGHELRYRSWIGDLDGDSEPEVLYISVEPVGVDQWEDVLYCLDRQGQVRWSYRLEDTFRFGAGSYGPPWFTGLVAVYDLDGEKRIAFSLSHSIWWPAPLLTLNNRGERLSTFVSSGLIYQLRAFVHEGRPLIVAGGVSNSHEAASLMVLNGDRPTGTTPEEAGSAFECLSCEAGAPLRYFSFPKTELALLERRPYNQTNSVQISTDSVTIGTLEVSPMGAKWKDPAVTFFEFDMAFRLKTVRWSDGFKPVHQAFERAGSVDHTAAACPNRIPGVTEFVAGQGFVEVVPSESVGAAVTSPARSAHASVARNKAAPRD